MNKNNFLRWSGSFNNYAIEIVADDKGPYILNTAPGDYLEIDLLATVTSTYPIDPKSVEITNVENNYFGDIIYNADTQKLLVYKPDDPVFLTLGSIGYRFKDRLGNQSNIGRVYIESTAITKAFRGYQPSYRCLTNGAGQNTGVARYQSRIQYYPSTGQDVKPTNIQSNTGQIPDVADTAFCPLPSQVLAAVQINCAVPPPLSYSLKITGITFKRGSLPDIVHSLNIGEGQTQKVVVPSAVYTDILISYQIILGSAPTTRAWSYTRLDNMSVVSGTYGSSNPFSIGGRSVFSAGAIIDA